MVKIFVPIELSGITINHKAVDFRKGSDLTIDFVYCLLNSSHSMEAELEFEGTFVRNFFLLFMAITMISNKKINFAIISDRKSEV